MTERREDPAMRGDGRPRRLRRWPFVVLVGLGVLAAGWTVAWSMARTRVIDEIDRQIAALARADVVVACPDRAVGGFPFRFEVACRDPGLEMKGRGVIATAHGLRVVAQAWDPFLVIAELDGPLAVAGGGGTVDAGWSRASLSLRWSRVGAERVSLAIEGPEFRATAVGRPPVRFSATHLEAHGRPSGEGGRDLDLAFAATGAALDVADKHIGPKTSDLDLSLKLVGFLPPGPGEPLRTFAARGGVVDPLRFTLASGGLTFAGKGALTLLPDGLIDGSIGVAARGLEALASGGARALGTDATTLASGFLLLGRPSNDPDLPGRRLDLVIDHGRPRLGRVAFAPIAPLF